MSKVLIAGGGAAGMFAAITAARQGQEVHVYEKNEKLERNCLSQEKEDVILQMPVTWIHSLIRLLQIPSFYTVVFMDIRIRM